MSGSAAPVVAGLAAGVILVSIFAVYSPTLQVYDNAPSRLRISEVTIPKGASMSQNGTNFEPAIIKVVIGLNNTVRWTNNDAVISSVVASNPSQDPEFAAAAESPSSGGSLKANIILPGKSFNFTFNRPGAINYHSEPHPWMQGTVIVLPTLTETPEPTDIIGSNNTSIHFENQLQHDYKEVPNLILATEDGRRLFQGEEGTYCLATHISTNLARGQCADSIEIFPQTLITLERDSVVRFRTFDNATLISVLPWVTNDHIEHMMTLNATNSNPNSDRYASFVMNLPADDYNLNTEFRWTYGNSEGRSYHHFRLHIH